MKLLGWKVVPVLLFLLISFFLWRGLSLDPHHLPSAKIGKPLPSVQLPDLHRPEVSVSFDTLRDKISLLNVWASWCAACVEEQVFLLQLARQGVPIYGLNYKDNPQNAVKWLNQWGNPYVYTLSDMHGLLALELGVYGAPETFIIDKQGLIQYRHAGVLTAKIWKDELQPLIKKLEQQS